MADQKIKGALILADESADWAVGGLRQLDRLALALNEYVGRTQDAAVIPVRIIWDDKLPPEQRRAVRDSRLTGLAFTEISEQFSGDTAKQDEQVLVVHTRLVVRRGGFAQMMEQAKMGVEVPMLLLPALELFDIAASYSSLAPRLSTPAVPSRDKLSQPQWVFLHDANDVSAAEKLLLRGAGKPQDGFVSRFVNRPLSRSVSRLLIRFPLSPNQCTLMLMVLPMAGSILLMQGNYLGFALGAIFFQLHSALDGCDGEIARTKYLESERGNRLDEACDRIATLLFVVSLGIGLSHQSGISEALRWIYLLEGVVTATLIGISESLLIRAKLEEARDLGAMNTKVYPRYVGVIKHSGVLVLGEGVVLFFVELTKRDVFNFSFMLLAFCGRAHWIMHIVAFCATISMLLTLRTMMVSGSAQERAPVPPATTS